LPATHLTTPSLRKLYETKLTIVALLCISGSALAEEKHHVSYKTSAANTKYAQQLNVAAGDAAGHIVRVWDLTRNHRDESIMINGIKLVEESARGLTDITDGNGSAVFYSVYAMENGDKFFARSTQASTGDAGTITAIAAGPITGGTGKFTNIRGVVKAAVKFNVTSGFNEGTSDIDYSMGE
jgi:hypothetical protein